MKENEYFLWFPNYGNNPGVTSKLLRLEIKNMLENFNVEILDTYFNNPEEFYVKIKLPQKYKNYISNVLKWKYGSFANENEVEVGSSFLGRIFKPKKVGFGIFIDIGIRAPKQRKDVLIPLYQLRQDLGLPNASTREIVKQLGLIDGLPVNLKITRIEDLKSEKRIYGKFDQSFLKLLNHWSMEKIDRLLVTKVLRTKVIRVIKEASVQKYLQNISYLDPLTTVISCDSKTNGSGLIPKIGSKIIGAPIGLFKYHSKK